MGVGTPAVNPDDVRFAARKIIILNASFCTTAIRLDVTAIQPNNEECESCNIC
jgi:hypothetical protein